VRLVVPYPVEVARLGEHPLAAFQLAEQRLVHPVDQGRLALQVGDHAGDVGEAGHLGEGGPALVVDQHQGQLLRRVPEREPGHQRAQQLALARPGRPDHQAMRAHAVLRSLLEVEVDGATVVADADGGPQQLGAAPGRPPAGLVERAGAVQAEQAEQAVGVDRGAAPAGGAQHQRRHRPGERSTGAASGVRPCSRRPPGASSV
jgi:hypothetical protein